MMMDESNEWNNNPPVPLPKKRTHGTRMLAVLLCGVVSGAIGGGVAGYAVSAWQQDTTVQAAVTSQTSRTVVEESNTATVVHNTTPSVVSIVISTAPEDASYASVQVCSGTGFVISADGMILTNRHVICEDDAVYTVEFDDGTSYDATVLARDPLTDIALLKINAQNLTPLTLGDSDTVTQGQTVIAIGNTLGEYANTVTKGIISGLSRDIGGNYTGLLQTDAAINEGNSGGPLLNLAGEVIGINTAIDRSGEGIGFAIPINEAKTDITSTQQFGRIVRPALGVRYIPVDSAVATMYDLAFDYGAYIEPQSSNGGQAGIVPGSAAEKAGLTEGDVILSVDGVNVDSENTLATMIKSRAVGDTVTLRVYRDGAEQDIAVTLEELPDTME